MTRVMMRVGCGIMSRRLAGGDVNAQAGSSTYALLTDGTTIEIRATRPDDFDAVRNMHAKMSSENLYLRFFGLSRSAAVGEARRTCREPAPDHAALLAVLEGQVVGCGSYEVAGDGSRSAEVAMAVADDMHRRGVGTLLLEHLISLARGRGVRTFVATTLSENALMMQVFADAGLGARRALVDGVYEVSFPLPAGEGTPGVGTYRDAVAERERSADVASLRHVLTPASVAVIGASRRPGSFGRAILKNIVDGGFPGPVYAVNPGAAELDGVPCVPSAAALPEPVDLAVIAAPAGAVVGIAENCGRRGIKALVVITSGLDDAARAELLGICRRHGMRLVGPTCFGVANTAISLDATVAARHPRPGMAGLAMQSGGVGVVLLEHLSRLRLGLSSFPIATRPFPWTRRWRPAIPGREWLAWPCSPAASAWSCSSTCPGSASGSPPSSPWATRMMCPATTCCCGGSPTRRRSWPCSTCSRSGTRASSPGRPVP